ncbi:MAG: 4Fe-4S binding protein [Candidatus Omnitrophica bacterium]|nr:4Fe-4S binding protein [Candidatus Omnitrophota bacterium]
MAKRKIIKIDQEKCNGCSQCIPNCPEGALQMIDGKAHLLSDLFCDGLGACIGHCPVDAISIEEREAQQYDEAKVMENIIKGGKNVIKAHLLHLKEHGDNEHLKEAIEVLKEKNIEIPKLGESPHAHTGCPGMKMMDFQENETTEAEEEGKRSSQLRQWPIQLHLVSPLAPYYQNKDVILSADCVAYALGDFHKDYLKGKGVAIACPKLDEGQEVYTEKIKALIDEANINTLTVMTMEVPCCMGLLQLVKEAAGTASRKIPIKHIIVGIKGDILKDEWIEV